MLMAMEGIESRRMFAVSLPTGFTDTPLASGLNQPTSLAELPDGRLLVTQKSGALRLIKSSGLVAAPVMTLAVDGSGERGLLSVTPDPNFASNDFVYVYYFPTGTNTGRISRFTLNNETAALSSEVVLLNLSAQAGSMSHAGGAIHFGTDGKLYIAIGDNQTPANAQSLANTHGKLLRINPDGTIPADNPFVGVDGALPAIYSYGLRNPFTFGVNSVDGKIFINDVGEKAFEEIDQARSGANFGWPTTEGPTDNPAYDTPVFAYSPPQVGVGESIAGGAFYVGVTQQFPADYAGKYFFGDYVQGTVRTLDPVTKTASPFATGVTKVVDIDVRPDGTLLVLGYDGIVHAMTYSSVPPSTAVIKGFTFNDSDRSGTFNTGDGLASGKTVFLDTDNDGVLDAGEKSTITDANGNFSFSSLPAGTYHVRRVFPSGYSSTTPPIDITLTPGQTASGLSIGSATTPVTPPPGNASFSGFVVNDTNKDGKWTSGEKGIAGRTVWNDLDNDGVLDSNEVRQITDSTGKFTFAGLAAGTYKFREVVPTGWTQTSPANGFGLSITLTAGQVKSGSSFQVTTA